MIRNDYRAWNKLKKKWFYFDISDIFCAERLKGFHYGDFENWCRATHLHDKNGKEIWEGDIVDSKDGRFVVEFGGASGGCTRFPLSGQYHGFECKIPWPCEVLGNIYENPELLENSK